MLVASLLMALFGTFNIAFALRFNLDAFIWYKGPDGPTGEFENLSYWVDTMKTVDYVIQTLVGDLILVSPILCRFMLSIEEEEFLRPIGRSTAAI